MAEAAGLALGAVALVSLFQTAVECLEYFELARDLNHDQELAATKVGLLEARLKDWGENHLIQGSGHETPTVWLHSPCWGNEGGNLVSHCLARIASILGNAAELNRIYGLDKRKRLQWPSVFPRLRSGLKPQSAEFAASETAAKRTASFRRQVVWAIRDKKKFDSLILELDFLVTNLEKVGDRLCRREYSNLGVPKSFIMSSNTHTLEDMERGKFPGRGHTIAEASSLDQQYQTPPPSQQRQLKGPEYNRPVAEPSSQMINGNIGRTDCSAINKYDQPHAKSVSLMVNGNSERGQDVATLVKIHGQTLIALANSGINPFSGQHSQTPPNTRS